MNEVENGAAGDETQHTAADDMDGDYIECWIELVDQQTSKPEYKPVYVLKPKTRQRAQYPPQKGAQHEMAHGVPPAKDGASANTQAGRLQCSSSKTTSTRNVLLNSVCSQKPLWSNHPVRKRSNRPTSSGLMPPRDPLLHVPIVTPPCPIQPGHLQTQSELRSYTHGPDLPTLLIPVLGWEFNSYDDAFNFFNDYAKHVGFGIRKGQKNDRRRYLYCIHHGEYKPSVHDADRQHDKVTKRIGCKWMMRLKERDDGTCVVKHIVIELNHRLLISSSALVFLHSHKTIDPIVKEYISMLISWLSSLGYLMGAINFHLQTRTC